MASSSGFRALIPVFLLLLFAAPTPGRCETADKDPKDPLEGLRPEHPRLMLLDGDLAALKARAKKDPLLAKCVKDVLLRAEKYLHAPLPRYEKRGPRLLHVSRDCLSRAYTLGLAWRWTGEERYAEAAEKALLAACAFPDWNPSHFLDTAEMSHAVGMGYDWLHGFLSPASRDALRAALLEKGLKPGLRAYTGKGAWWVHSAFNWNQVCNSGLLIGALAVADTDPGIARTLLAHAVASLPRAISTYDPDGAWPEGPGYWHYATAYTVYGLSAMETALGRDFGLSRSKGLAAAARFPLYAAGPTGLLFNFADCGAHARRGPLPELFRLSARYGDPWPALEEQAFLRSEKALPLHVVWYPAPVKAPPPEPPLDRLFRGPVETAFFRSAWHDPNALFLAVKAGYNQVNHGHLDLGNFVLDALGVRWILDLGADDYNLPGYWQSGRKGKRWSYYRLNSLSHNVPLLDGKGQNPEGKARVVRVRSAPERAFVVVDLSSAYAPRAKKVWRGAALLAGRRAVLVQDEYTVETPCTVCFGLTTDAKVEAVQAGSVLLSKQGKHLRLRVLAPKGVEIRTASAERPPPEKRNRGIVRIEISCPLPAGTSALAVLFSPEKEGAAPVQGTELRPLEQW